jgi:molybdate ABC transporter, permease protein
VNATDLLAVWLTLKLATVATAILLVVGTPLAWWLARSHKWFRPAVEALVTLPLVLPPTVLGFYLLLLLGRSGPLAPLLEALDLSLVFSFTGLVVASLVFSLPFVVNPLKNAFQEIPGVQLESAAILGAGRFYRFFTVALPLARAGYLTAFVMGFAHTLGEFGVVLMIGGSIPGETQLLSIAIYRDVEQLDYGRAHLLAGGALLVSFVALTALYFSARSRQLLRL